MILLKGREETLKKQWELSETAINLDTERKNEKQQEALAALKLQLQVTDTKLQNIEHSFYGWLNRNRKNWLNDIGKVCSDELLFSNSLEPVSDDSANDHFYGVKIDLHDVTVRARTVSDYNAEKRQLEQDIANQQQQLQQLRQNQTEQLDKLKKKYQPLIRECKDGIIEQQYNMDQDNMKLQQALLLQKDIEVKAAEAKQKALAEADMAIASCTEALIVAEKSVTDAENDLHKQVRAKEKEYEKKLVSIEQAVKNNEQKIKDSFDRYQIDYRARREAVVERRQQELDGKGVDTKRISVLEQRLAELELTLQQIEKSRDTVAEYKKDKRELIDKTDDFKTNKTNLEQQFSVEAQKYHLQKEQLDRYLEIAGEKIEQLRIQLQQAEDDDKAFESFKITECYHSIEPAYKEENNLYKTDFRSIVLIDQINSAYYTAIKRLDELKEAVNKFLGNFSSQNIFNFKTNLSSREEHLYFAEQLNEFISDSKIEEYVKRVNERFATIIHSVGRETGTLMSKGGEIQKVIVSINNDFENKNFVGAIKKIELRLDESSNKVVQLLLQIKKFNDEHSYDLGGINLFSSIDQDSKNKKAADLLKQLGKAIVEYRKESISLSDSFELRFRIEENDNDTGWVEKLSNVGSEGTDVLVKAMINIMLLNVFKEGASKRFKHFRLHCMMDEIGKLHPNNVKGILQFANDRNMNLINGSPTENNALDYKHIYKLEKDSNRYTRIKRIITNHAIS